MAGIKLFSGMDFSGKSTIIEIIERKMPSIFKVQKKFLTPIDMIQKVRTRDSWLPPEEWKPLIQKTVKEDIQNYKENGLILQDSLWIIKYIATKIEKNSQEDYEEIEILKELLNKYPDMDSFYLTTTIEERINRFNLRESSGNEITGSDKLLLSKEKFEKIENIYKKLVFNRFPNTRIIDTTNKTPEEVAQEIMNDKNFLKNL